MNTIQVKGNSNLDSKTRFNSLSKINNLDTDTLVKIAELLKNEKTQEKFKANFSLLKTLI